MDRSLTSFEVEVIQPPNRSWTAQFSRVFILGVEHILIGYDHILFLLALLVVAKQFRQMVKVASAFTVAHSITLALAWYGIVDLPSRIVESAIALSIAIVAIENIVRQRFYCPRVMQTAEHCRGRPADFSHLVIETDDCRIDGTRKTEHTNRTHRNCPQTKIGVADPPLAG